MDKYKPWITVAEMCNHSSSKQISNSESVIEVRNLLCKLASKLPNNGSVVLKSRKTEGALKWERELRGRVLGLREFMHECCSSPLFLLYYYWIILSPLTRMAGFVAPARWALAIMPF